MQYVFEIEVNVQWDWLFRNWRWRTTTALSLDIHFDVKIILPFDRHIRTFAGSLEPESLSHTLIGHPQ